VGVTRSVSAKKKEKKHKNKEEEKKSILSEKTESVDNWRLPTSKDHGLVGPRELGRRRTPLEAKEPRHPTASKSGGVVPERKRYKKEKAFHISIKRGVGCYGDREKKRVTGEPRIRPFSGGRRRNTRVRVKSSHE